jgi:hypothetical protein
MAKKTPDVLYPEVITEKYIGDAAMDVDTAKDLLGWENEEEGRTFKEFNLKDHAGRKVKLTKNPNRPLDLGWVNELKQNHLRKTFRFNGEAIIVDRLGNVRSGQHRLVSFILAEQQRDASPETWEHIWGKTGPVTLETIVVKGTPDDALTIQTLDNVKPRSLADSLYTDEELFGKMKSHDRVTVTKILEGAIKKVRYRTHADKQAYRPRRTHAEEVAFLDLHGKLKDAAKHIFQENQTHTDTEYRDEEYTEGDQLKTRKVKVKETKTVPLGWLKLSPGSCAGLLYLMATSGTTEEQAEKYWNLRGTGNATEKKLDFSRWDAATKFWSLLADITTGNPPLMAIRRKIAALLNPNGESGGTTAEREDIVIKGFNLWIDDQLDDDPVTMEKLKLGYTTHPDTQETILDVNQRPQLGGIDFGVPRKEEDEDTTEGDGVVDETGGESEVQESADESEMTEEEMERRKAEVRAETAAAPKKRGRPAKV